MSITSTIRTMRKQEILADLPKMSVTDLMSRRTELRSILRANPTESQLSKQEISDITMSISRELTTRAEAKQTKDGINPKQQSEALIEQSKQARKHDINRIAKQKLDRARTDFDANPNKFEYIERHGKNPYEQTIADFGGSTD